MPGFTRLILIRHGAVAAPWPDRVYGQLDVPLSQEGEQEARRVVTGLEGEHLDAVTSSGLARAEFTAALLRASRGLERRDDARLLELDRGPWAGRAKDDIAAAEPELWAASLASGGVLNPPGGERIEDLAARVVDGLQAAADLHPDGQVAVVAHMWVIRVAVASVLGLDLRRVAILAVPTSGVVLLEWPPSSGPEVDWRPRLLAFGADRLPPRHPLARPT